VSPTETTGFGYRIGEPPRPETIPPYLPAQRPAETLCAFPHVINDEPGKYYLETGYSQKWKKPLFFGSAVVQKNYVSYYLMPVYMFPDLLEGVSPALKNECRKIVFQLQTEWMKCCFRAGSAPDRASLAQQEGLI
jgi:hypothetical protein